MEKISIEYCHVTPGAKDTNKIIADNNIWMPRVMKMFSKDKVQKCIMIDDIHTNSPVN
jgi:outer membrane lipoprotein-sorting protein